jgi:argininosuccinate lyase
MSNSKLWGGRFSKEMNSEVAQFTSSLEVDYRLWRADIEGSLAHAEMLGRQGILQTDESNEILAGLKQVRDAFEQSERDGTYLVLPTAEDIHSEIDRILHEKIGAVAGKLHTARSRNDQVATATRLTIARATETLASSIHQLQTWFVATADNETETILPGLTHFQPAQPVSLAHHLLSYFWMLDRDRERLADFRKRALRLPLGSAALAGTSFNLDREFVAKRLGFTSVIENSLDAVSDRDFVVEFLSATSILMMHLSRLCEELIIWSSPRYGFITLDDSVTTGSSIMPQKKNPDVAELIRGRSGRAYGALMGMLTTLKSLPQAYNRDLQEDKLFLFQGLDVAQSSVTLMTLMLESAEFHRARMQAALAGDFSNATDLADDLARKGIAFREAHEVVGRIVKFCLDQKLPLEQLTLTQLREFNRNFDEASVAALSHRAVLMARTSQGGTGPLAVKAQIELAKIKLKTDYFLSSPESPNK